MKLGSSNLGTPSPVWSSSPLGIFWEHGRNAEWPACPRPTDSESAFWEGPQGICMCEMHCSKWHYLPSTWTFLPHLVHCFCFSQTWLFPYPPHPLHFPSLVCYFNYFLSNSLNSPTPQVSLSLLQNASKPFLSYSLITQCLHTKVSCFVDSIHFLLIKQLPERNSERNLSPVFSWMGCSSFHCFCLSVYS